MQPHFLLHPSLQVDRQLLDAQLKKDESAKYVCVNSSFDIDDMLASMDGYPISDELKQWCDKPESRSWTIDGKPHAADFRDVAELSGCVATFFLNPAQWSALSVQERAAIGVYVENVRYHTPARASYTFSKNDKSFLCEVGDDNNKDPEIHRWDITHYSVLDPFGVPVQYRPAIKQSAYFGQNTETSLMVALLAYAQQMHLPIAPVAPMDKKYKGDVERHMNCFGDYPIPQLASRKPTPVYVPRNHGGATDCYIDDDRLVFVSRRKEIYLALEPEEVPLMVNALIAMADNHGGRTPAGELRGIVEYYHKL